MRVGLIAIQHESNTFVRARTTLKDFRRDALLFGSEMAQYCRACHHEVGGFWHELQRANCEVVPLLLALATPGGPLDADTGAELVRRMLQELRRAGPLDGLLVAPHGAAVCDAHADFDGHWLCELREQVGEALPIVATLDPHANLSERMFAATDAIVAYRTNPHVDQHQTGRTAAGILLATLGGKIQPTQAMARPPVAISIDRQATSESPCRELYELADSMLQADGIASNSVILGFPYADVEELGTSFIVVTDRQPDRAQQLADEWAADLVARREQFGCALPDVDAALEELRSTNERTCLLDVGDNVGGGAAGDGTLLLRRLYDGSVADSLVCLWDPSAVAQARVIGVGETGELSMGGQHAIEQGPPLVADVRVERIVGGRFEEPNLVHGGRSAYDMGPTAVVRTSGGMTVVLMSNRVPPFSLGQITSCQLDPERFRVLVAKGVNAPIAAYRDVCDRFIRVNTPGVTCADMTQLEFRHRRRPLHPFDDVAATSAG